VPFLCAVVLLCTSDLFRNPKFSLPAIAIVLVVGLVSPHPPVFGDGKRDRPYSTVPDARGVADERIYYYPTTGLLHVSREFPYPTHRYAIAGREARRDRRRVIITDSVGMFGFYAGPEKHIADEFGLVDPLLSRLPVPDPIHWRIGHFKREVPTGYKETLMSGTNRIADPAIAELYDNLVLITRGKLLSGDRIKAIWKVNTGQCAVAKDQSTR
jgi:arabinofuranosyltransferase